MTHRYDLVPGVMRVLPKASGRSQPDSGLGRHGDCSVPFCAAIGNSVAAPGKMRYLRALGELSVAGRWSCRPWSKTPAAPSWGISGEGESRRSFRFQLVRDHAGIISLSWKRPRGNRMQIFPASLCGILSGTATMLTLNLSAEPDALCDCYWWCLYLIDVWPQLGATTMRPCDWFEKFTKSFMFIQVMARATRRTHAVMNLGLHISTAASGKGCQQ